jgi:hypothetical protein
MYMTWAYRRYRKNWADTSRPNSEGWQESASLSKVLDSIANLCVSEANHEVIATALRVKAESIELIIASNTDIKSSTVGHLGAMWKVLKKISTSCHLKFYGLNPQEVTPPQLAPDTHQLGAEFRRLCLRFSFGKLQKRVHAKFSRFSAISIDNMDESHPFQLIRKRVNAIEKHFTREKKLVTGKPDYDNEL